MLKAGISRPTGQGAPAVRSVNLSSPPFPGMTMFEWTGLPTTQVKSQVCVRARSSCIDGKETNEIAANPTCLRPPHLFCDRALIVFTYPPRLMPVGLPGLPRPAAKR